MVDITCCSDQKCPSRTLCYRYTASKDEYQSYFAKSPRKKDAMRCSEFWENSRGSKDRDSTQMCECDAFGIPHKYNPICQLHEIASQKHTTICDIYAKKVCKKQPKVCKRKK